jgi:hypothetical protein
MDMMRLNLITFLLLISLITIASAADYACFSVDHYNPSNHSQAPKFSHKYSNSPCIGEIGEEPDVLSRIELHKYMEGSEPRVNITFHFLFSHYAGMNMTKGPGNPAAGKRGVDHHINFYETEKSGLNHTNAPFIGVWVGMEVDFSHGTYGVNQEKYLVEPGYGPQAGETIGGKYLKYYYKNYLETATGSMVRMEFTVNPVVWQNFSRSYTKEVIFDVDLRTTKFTPAFKFFTKDQAPNSPPSEFGVRIGEVADKSLLLFGPEDGGSGVEVITTNGRKGGTGSGGGSGGNTSTGKPGVTTSGSGSKSNAALIAGDIVGVVIFILVAVVVGYLIMKRKKGKKAVPGFPKKQVKPVAAMSMADMRSEIN